MRNHFAALLALVVATSTACTSNAPHPQPAGAGAIVQAQAPAPPKPWTLTEPQIREIVGRVRAGRDLTPKSWPNGARVAVGLSFDVDNEAGYLRDNLQTPSVMSQGEYGSRAALPRILALLQRHGVPATFFVPGVTALLHPDSMKSIASAGIHEIATHSWIHERNSQLDEATERELLKRALDTLERVTGRRPVGMRTASWDYSPYTLALAREAGLVYDSSLMADDRPYEVLANGEATGVVQLPVEWILDDYPYYGMDRTSTIRPTMNPDEVFAIWKAEFDGAYEERTLLILTMHPHISGHRARLAMVDRLVSYMKSRPGVWFATHEQIARYVAEQAGLTKRTEATGAPQAR